MKKYSDRIKKSKKEIKESFPPDKGNWCVYIILKKMPKLLKYISKGNISRKMVYFINAEQGARGVATEEEDFKGRLVIIGLADPNNIDEILIDTQNPDTWKTVTSRHVDSLSTIVEELNK